MKGIKTAKVTLGDETLRVAAVSGLGNTEKLIQKIESGKEHFDFVEVMACQVDVFLAPASHSADELLRNSVSLDFTNQI